MLKLNCQETEFVSRLKAITPPESRAAVFEKLLADANRPADRMQLYHFNGIYNKLFAELSRYPYLGTFQSYEEDLRTWDSERTLKLYAEILKREMDRACDCKQYRHVAAHLDRLKVYPKGQEEANTLVAYWYVYHKNRPAMKDELKKAGYLQEGCAKRQPHRQARLPFCVLEIVSEKLDPFQQKINQITVENAVLIIEIMGNVHPDDDFLKEVTGELQRIQFSGFFLLRAHLEGGLDIEFSVSVVDDEINLFLDIASVSAVYHNAHIYAISPADQVIVDDVFHNVTGIILPIIEPGISETDVGVVILVGIVEVGLAFDIISLSHADQKCINGMADIGRN